MWNSFIQITPYFVCVSCIYTNAPTTYLPIVQFLSSLLPSDNIQTPSHCRLFILITSINFPPFSYLYRHRRPVDAETRIAENPDLSFATVLTLHCSLDNSRIQRGCLRGQQCQDNGTRDLRFLVGRFLQTDMLIVKKYACVATSEPISCYAASGLHIKQSNVAFPTDGTCGAAHGGTLCSPPSAVYTGSCSSI